MNPDFLLQVVRDYLTFAPQQVFYSVVLQFVYIFIMTDDLDFNDSSFVFMANSQQDQDSLHIQFWRDVLKYWTPWREQYQACLKLSIFLEKSNSFLVSGKDPKIGVQYSPDNLHYKYAENSC